MNVKIMQFIGDKDVPQLVGQITLEGNKLSADTDAAKEILNEPVYDAQLGRTITAQDDPQRFVKALHYNYNGAYLWATVPH